MSAAPFARFLFGCGSPPLVKTKQVPSLVGVWEPQEGTLYDEKFEFDEGDFAEARLSKADLLTFWFSHFGPFLVEVPKG